MRQPARFALPAGHIIGSWANEIFARLAVSPDQGRLFNICLICSSSHTAPKTPIAMRANSNVSRIICRFPMRKRLARLSRTGALPGRTISHARGQPKEEFPGSLGRQKQLIDMNSCEECVDRPMDADSLPNSRLGELYAKLPCGHKILHSRR
jgi:hypothetical protein